MNFIVGGGITGLFSAYYAKTLLPSEDVYLIEASPDLGGLLRSKFYETYGTFDIGIHTFYQTKVPEIDNFFENLEFEGGWKWLRDYDRDLGGAVWDENVNYSSPFIDLRKVDSDLLDLYRNEVQALNDINPDDLSDVRTANDFFTKRFGSRLAQDVFNPAVENRTNASADSIHWLAARIQGLLRVALYDLDEMMPYQEKGHFSSRVSFPSQKHYPEEFLSGSHSFYPAKFGLYRVIDEIKARLIKMGVQILCETQICAIDADSDAGIREIKVNSSGEFRNFPVKNLIWTIPPFAVHNMLMSTEGGSKSTNKNKKKKIRKTAILNIVTNEKPVSNGVYYIYTHDSNFMHRVSFPSNYSDEIDGDGHKLCVELILDQESDLQKTSEQALEYLVKRGILSDLSELVFKDIYFTIGGFPQLTTESVDTIMKMHRDIADLNYSNLINVGVLSKDNLFFQKDLLMHAQEELSKLA